MLNLEEEILIERASEILEDINQKERTGDKDMLKPALEDYQKVVGRIEAIKNSRSQ